MDYFNLDMSKLERKFKNVFPLSRFGTIYSHHNQNMTYTNKLEFCLRYSSGEEYAIDIIDGKEYRTPYPHVIMKLPECVHSYKIRAPRDAVYFQYSPELEEDMRKASLLAPPLCWQVKMTPGIITLVNKMKELAVNSHEEYVADWIDMAALQIIEKLISQRKQKDSHPQYIETGIRRIASYFNLNFTKEINMGKLLSANGFSQRNFFRHWKKFYNVTPAEYVKELKLQYARTLLEETNRPVFEIAYELNYQNSYYLCRLFKKRFGTTPHQYRKKRDILSK